MSNRVRAFLLGSAVFILLSNAAVAQSSLNVGDWRLHLDSNGELERLTLGSDTVATSPGGQPRIGLLPEGAADPWQDDAAQWLSFGGPASEATSPSGFSREYDLGASEGLRVRVELAFETVGEWPVIRQSVTLIPAAPVTRDIRIVVPLPFRFSPGTPVFVPRYDGLGETVSLDAARSWTWLFDGAGRPIADPAQQLALPVLSAGDKERAHACTHIADPEFATSFSFNAGGDAVQGAFECIYTGKEVPLSKPFTRTLWTVIHPPSPEVAMEAWYATALADVPPGPEWLHDVAWQHYDYLSHGGRGWFEDIDAAEKIVAPEDRRKVVFTLHGWYDLLGRYTFDVAIGRLDETWTAFPNAEAVRERGFNVSESVEMSKEEMHRRIRYAKDRGFRVCLYFADGLTACEGAGVFAEDKLLSWGGWQGPDTLGRSYMQNPAHPEVFAWYVAYLKALLKEYGSEIDALVWDETFMIRAGMRAPENAPEKAYLCGPMLRLMKELTRITTEFRSDLAFLASDDVGMTNDDRNHWRDVPPYAIMAHGCYQDSHSRPTVWPYGIFPNLRNVLWSCNWSAVSRLDYTRFGVEHYATPVATSNGWLDNGGIARLSEADRQAVVDLFNARKTRRQHLRWLTGPAPVLEKQ
jgi:hypothetical protein